MSIIWVGEKMDRCEVSEENKEEIKRHCLKLNIPFWESFDSGTNASPLQPAEEEQSPPKN